MNPKDNKDNNILSNNQNEKFKSVENNNIIGYNSNESIEDDIYVIYKENNNSFDNFREVNYITENYYTINNTNKLTELL